MSREACFRVKRMPEGHVEMIADIAEQGVAVLLRGELLRIFGIERLCHVEPVQPDLVRIHLLVPECPLRSPRLGIELFPERSQHPAVFPVACLVVQPVIDTARTDVVDIVILLPVGDDFPVFVSHGVRPVTDIVLGIWKSVTVGHVKE